MKDRKVHPLVIATLGLIFLFNLTGMIEAGQVGQADYDDFIKQTSGWLTMVKAEIDKVPAGRLINQRKLDSQMGDLSDALAKSKGVAAADRSKSIRSIKGFRMVLGKTYYDSMINELRTRGDKDALAKMTQESTRFSRDLSYENMKSRELASFKNDLGVLPNRARSRSAGPPQGFDDLMADFGKAYDKAAATLERLKDSDFAKWKAIQGQMNADLKVLDAAHLKVRRSLDS